MQQTAMAGAGVMLANPLRVFSQSNQPIGLARNIKSKGYAGKDEHRKLTAWNFERRPVGDNDILIEIKYSGICHSDLHHQRALGRATLSPSQLCYFPAGYWLFLPCRHDWESAIYYYFYGLLYR